MNEQHTLCDHVVFDGVGLHTGRDARVVVSPSEPGSGLHFLLNGRVVIPALVEYVVDTKRATVLGAEGESVSTVEHLLSALTGLHVDNARIAVDGPEIPVLDGSALPFVEAINAAGRRAQGVPRAFLPLEDLRLEERDMELHFTPAAHCEITMDVEFRAPIGAQHFSAVVDPELYTRDIAGARTFGYLDEVEALRERGLALGGSLDNAVVFAPDGPMQALRFADEPVRHKVLDLIGDFALIGAPLQAHIHARRSGHALHAKAVRMLRERVKVLK